MIAQLMGTDTVRVWHDQVQIKPARIGGPTVWHQDHPYWPVIQPADLVSAWVALEDATIENGCMSMVPHSHKWGPYNGGTVGIDSETWGPAHDPAFVPAGETVSVVPVPVKAGSVVFHHCLMWHGAPPNRSDRDRPAIAVHYMPGHTRYQPTEKGHLVEHNITVKPGEILTGAHFPTVMEAGKPLAAPG
jgi:ectoine hydroxylase-related dioxygenase (phytanoyl-CoA dioxygenase family)